MKTMKILVASLFCLATFTMSAQTKTITLKSFDEIKAFDQIHVTLIKSSENKAVISGDDIDEVAIVNNSGKLKIRMELDNFLDGNDTHVKLYYTDNIELIDANEGTKIMSDDTIETNYLVINAQEGGDVDVSVEAKNVDVKVVSGGEAKVNGDAPSLEVTVRSGGDFYGKDLDSENASVSVFAGGGARISADKYVDASVTAGGSISIYGNPDKIDRTKTFGGSITEM